MKKVSNMKVLLVSPALNLCGGVEKYLISYYRELHNQVDFTFVTHDATDKEYLEEITNNGDKVFILSKISGKTFLKNYLEIKNFLKHNHDFDIIHCNMPNAAFIYLHFAEKYGIKVRIMHSHETKYADKLSHALRNKPLIDIGKKYATNYLACSVEAGKYFFGAKKYNVVKNCIDVDKFVFNDNVRKKIRNKLNLDDNDILLANVGRFVPAKNQMFLLSVFKKINMINSHFKLIIIGDGELEDKIKSYVINNALTDSVYILNSQPNINEYMQAFDAFLLPSIYEGLGIVNIESQASGLKTFVSSGVSRAAEIDKELIKFLPLDESIWTVELLNCNFKYKRLNNKKKIAESGFSLSHNAKSLFVLYSNFLKENK